MKTENGIGYIKLILGICIIIVAVVFAVSYVKKEIKKENVEEMQLDLLLVQGKVELLQGNHSMNNEAVPLKGYQLTVIPENINVQDFFEKNVITQEEYEKYYLLDNVALQEMGLEELVNKYDGYFIVNYENFEIIYSKGYENVYGLWCYRITDLYKVEEVNNKEQQSLQETTITEENSNTDNVQ